ncbi:MULTISPECIES: SIMPL domain-containing protein [unclassified Leptolyngbya]|uniref:SIMPL domain-containing protein n=1 Tax=unclassified Leptolyngbya TaxID=2650499 RepID=UPI001684965B|nr:MULTISPECIES: SIMPL domain-containing protein [unclassified Leptolyngbya]MBD1910328.1 SIMPL domain-containing protein [Leptolyngbya sp. FACHB-8]MBD2154869.1 SIMPL domain-containing protein [Leptolyngbya sp. FACHB-16]
MKPDHLVRVPQTLSWKVLLPLAVGCLNLVTMKPALADEPLTRVITVTGVGTENVATSQAQVQLGVEVQGETAEEVQEEAARRSAAVVEFLRSRNVSNLRTTGITLNPMYNYTDGDQRIIGYMANNSVQFRVSNEVAGTILDDAVAAGATRIDSVSFIAADDALRQARRQALREATEDAQDQAEAVLDALGLSQQEVVTIQVNSMSQPPVYPPLARQAMAADEASTPVIGGEQEVMTNVTLQIRY